MAGVIQSRVEQEFSMDEFLEGAKDAYYTGGLRAATWRGGGFRAAPPGCGVFAAAHAAGKRQAGME